MRRLAVLAILLAACSPDASTASSTTTSGPTTTTAVPTTTTEPPATTSTSMASTTTSIMPATTTTETSSGNWASQPLVVSEFGALGWWNGAAWVQVDESTPLPVSGGEDYQVAALGFTGIVVGGAEELLCEPLFNPGVTLNPPDRLGAWPGPYGVAVSAPWDLRPNVVQSLADDGTYAAYAVPLLSNRGLNVPKPVIKQLFRVDLEGDGVNEVIVVVENIAGPGLFPTAGDYSLAFLRKVVQGEVQTAILGDSVIVNAEGAFLVSYTVGAIADLSGDGQMEVVIDAAYYEGLGLEVWEYVNDDLGMLPAIQTGCGS